MASVFKRGNKWYCSFKEGERWIKKIGGNTREEALQTLESYCPGETRPPALVVTSPFVPISEAYLAKLRIYAKRRSHETARTSCRHLIEHFRTHSFDQGGLDSFIEKMLSRGSRKTVNNHLVSLRAACNYAIESGKLDRMPFRIKLLKVSKKRVLPVLGKEEVDRLLAAAKDPYFGILLVCAHTGFRLSEVLNLIWREVNPQEGSLSVTEKAGWSSKSHQERTVFVPPRVIQYLEARREKAKLSGPEDYVFVTRSGRPISQHNACRELRKPFQRVGLYQKGRPLTHWLRHSVISQLLMGGVDVETAREISGHASLSTLALYARTVAAKKKAAAGALPW